MVEVNNELIYKLMLEIQCTPTRRPGTTRSAPSLPPSTRLRGHSPNRSQHSARDFYSDRSGDYSGRAAAHSGGGVLRTTVGGWNEPGAVSGPRRLAPSLGLRQLDHAAGDPGDCPVHGYHIDAKHDIQLPDLDL